MNVLTFLAHMETSVYIYIISIHFIIVSIFRRVSISLKLRGAKDLLEVNMTVTI